MPESGNVPCEAFQLGIHRQEDLSNKICVASSEDSDVYLWPQSQGFTTLTHAKSARVEDPGSALGYIVSNYDGASENPAMLSYARIRQRAVRSFPS